MLFKLQKQYLKSFTSYANFFGSIKLPHLIERPTELNEAREKKKKNESEKIVPNNEITGNIGLRKVF